MLKNLKTLLKITTKQTLNLRSILNVIIKFKRHFYTIEKSLTVFLKEILDN